MTVRITKAKRPKYHHHAVTTVTQARSAIFSPTLRPTTSKAVVVVETPWAKATISRVQLTQVHRDILDVLFTHCDPKIRADGSCAFVFHPHTVMRHLGHAGGVNIEWLVAKFDDLENAGLEVVWPKYTVRTSIIRKHAWTKDHSQYAVILESEYMQFFVNDLRVHSEGLTDAILGLMHAPTKAMVRFVISHRSWNRSLDETLAAIGYVGGERSRRRAKEKIVSEAEALLRDFGIVVKAGAIRYEQHGKVWFENPLSIVADAS
ncbi:MAG: hypothetical protein ACYC8W_01865 [Candidatus Tyrphobacter sp.]